MVAVLVCMGITSIFGIETQGGGEVETKIEGETSGSSAFFPHAKFAKSAKESEEDRTSNGEKRGEKEKSDE